MSLWKLSKLENLGFSENTIDKLVIAFENFARGGVMNYYDILKNTRQKTKIDELIKFLLEKDFIEDMNEDKENYEDKQFRVLVGEEKEKSMILYNKTKQLIQQRLDGMIKNKNDGWIVFIDFANSSKVHSSADYTLRDDIIKTTIQIILKTLIDKYTLSYKGFDIANTTKGDEIEFYFFDELSCDKFIKDFLIIYTKDTYSKVKTFNQNITTTNKIKDFLYLKIFKADSLTTEYSIRNNEMPSFSTMSAIQLISKVEKPIKNKFINDMKLSTIEKYFYVSNKMEDNLQEAVIEIEGIGTKTMYYEIK